MVHVCGVVDMPHVCVPRPLVTGAFAARRMPATRRRTRARAVQERAAEAIQRAVRRREPVLNDWAGGLPVCPITSNGLHRASRMKVVHDGRRVVFYDPHGLYTWITKSCDFRCPVGRRELNRIEIARCARLQSGDKWVGQQLQAYALAMYDARAARGLDMELHRAEVANRVERMQLTFREALDCLRARLPRSTTSHAFRTWHRAHVSLREIDMLSACHEAISHMDMFTMGREMHRAVHEHEYGRDMSAVTKAFQRMLESLRVHQPVPLTTYARVRRLVREEHARRQRRLVRLAMIDGSDRSGSHRREFTVAEAVAAEMMSGGGGGVVV